MPEHILPSPSTPAAPAELRRLREEVNSLREQLSRVEGKAKCGLCHHLLRSPVLLRCGHSFCSECARDALRGRGLCPEPNCGRDGMPDELRPVRALESVVRHLRLGGAAPDAPSSPVTPQRGRVAPQLLSSRTALITPLRGFGLPVDGTDDALKQRHREFERRWNANLDSAHPQSMQAIAGQVVAAEELAAPSRRAGGSASRGLAPNLGTPIRKGRSRDARSPSVRSLPEQTPPQGPSAFELALIEATDSASQTQGAAQGTPLTQQSGSVSAPPEGNPRQSAWRQDVSNVTQPLFTPSQTSAPPGGPSQGRPQLTDAQRARIARNRAQAVAKQLAARQRRNS